MPAPEILGSLILKLLGSIAGSILALLFRPPKSWRDFQRRGLFAIIAGVSLTPIAIIVLRRFFDIADDAETIVAVATITAFVSWWGAGTAIKLVSAWQAKAVDE